MQNSKKTVSRRETYIPNMIVRVLKSHWRRFERVRIVSVILTSIIFAFSACTANKNLVYFQNLPKDTTLNNVVTENYDLKIQKNDLLSIAVASLSPDVAFYNAPQNSVGGNNGYAVDQNGNISFVKLGTLHVAGMTRKELKDTLQAALVPYLRDAVVSVGFLNRHVTMIGAISPQVLPMPGDNMTILDALAASGDIGDKGKMDNVLVIRENGSSKDFKRLDLRSDSIFFSPYYYLQPNDIVYVEPEKTKNKLSATQIVSYVTAGISIFTLILTQVIK